MGRVRNIWSARDYHGKSKSYTKDGVPRHCTLDEVAIELGVSRERARQIENEALAKLRRLMKRQGLTAEDFL